MWSQFREPLTIVLCISVQSLIASVFWNYFMIHYNTILETDDLARGSNISSVLQTQNSILRWFDFSISLSGLAFVYLNPSFRANTECHKKVSAFSYQFWKVRTVLNSSDPEYFKTVLWSEKSPKNNWVTGIFPNWYFFLGHPVVQIRVKGWGYI